MNLEVTPPLVARRLPKLNPRYLLILIVAGLIAAYFVFDLGRYLNLATLKTHQAALIAHYHAHPITTLAIYAATYVAAAALSIPGALVLTLAGGALFGLWTGTLVVSFASTLGATLAFLVARLLFKDAVQKRFARELSGINQGVTRDGAFYLFALRLVPLFPFFVVNLVMALTPLRTRTFYWVSQLGMLPATLVFVNAGQRLGQLDSAAGLLSPGLIGAFALLGIFPIFARKGLDMARARHRTRAWPKPKHFDYNLLVIGAGAAGLSCAYLGAALKARVALIERGEMGGDCLNTGCVPSKALLRSAHFVAEARRAETLGLRAATVTFDFAEVMARVKRVIARVAPHDSVERYQGLGVEVIQASARLVSPWEVEVNGKRLAACNIVLATGATPAVPNIPGLAELDFLTSDTVWSLHELPARLLVLGGGPIGCELAQACARLGAQVTLVEQAAMLLPREDPECTAYVASALAADGVAIHTGHTALAFTQEHGTRALHCRYDHGETTLPFDRVLVALGRRARTQNLGLEALGIALTERGTVEVDAHLATRYPNIYAIGDLAGPNQLTHAAAHQAWYAAVNALFSPWVRFKADYRALPWCTYTAPELARVGVNEPEARAQGIAYEITRFDLAELDRAIAEEHAEGLIKVLTVPGKDRILGVTIAGAHAGELIAPWVLALRHKLGLKKLLATVYCYPTFMEANKYAAGAWQREHAPERVLGWLARYHARRARGNGQDAETYAS